LKTSLQKEEQELYLLIQVRTTYIPTAEFQQTQPESMTADGFRNIPGFDVCKK
jgi:hypothetical protein